MSSFVVREKKEALNLYFRQILTRILLRKLGIDVRIMENLNLRNLAYKRQFSIKKPSKYGTLFNVRPLLPTNRFAPTSLVLQDIVKG